MSRWGNFLQGIESGLDKILAEESTEIHKATTTSTSVKPQSSISKQADISQQKPQHKLSDRLQDRLAKTVDVSSSEQSRAQKLSRKSFTDHTATQGVKPQEEEDAFARENDAKLTNANSSRPEAGYKLESAVSLHISSNDTIEHSQDGRSELSKDTSLLEPTPTKQSDLTSLDESYLVERVESLQAKLNVFIHEARTKARAEIDEAPNEAARASAMLQERMALLMAEGQALSQREMRHLSTIRRLHGRVSEVNASLREERQSSGDARRMIQILQSKIESLESERHSVSSESSEHDLRSELEDARLQISTQSAELQKLRREAQNPDAHKLQSQIDRLRQDVVAEKRKNSSLTNELESIKIERDTDVGRLKMQLADQLSKAGQERDRSSSVEGELQGEIKNLESRLESLRTRNEEATSGLSDGQTKQLRQIEALQRQYAVSKDNWNGIEASLNLRISSLEGDRNQLSRKEADVRRKLKDALASLRKQEDKVEELKTGVLSLEEKLRMERNASRGANDALSKAQTEAVELREKLKLTHDTSNSRLERIEMQDNPELPHVLGPHDTSTSPFTSRKTPIAFESRARKAVNGLGFLPMASPLFERPTPSRNASIASPSLPSHSSIRHQPLASVTRSSSRSALRDTPSVATEDDLGTFEEMNTPVTPGRAFEDVISASASTSAAGPSVQLVERMTSAVRRLKSEKAATRDELERMAMERDEARKQIVSLLEEAEAKRSLEGVVFELKRQATETAQRYQTTLELLGEKSELVEELRADIVDMKTIYRENLEKSVKG